MDWIRRNWPDLLIGVALIAVIAGILATLLRGDTLWGGNNRAGRTDPPSLTQAQPAREPLLTPNPEVASLRSEVLPTGVTIEPIVPNLPSIDAPQAAADPPAPSNQALTLESSALGATGTAPAATTGATTATTAGTPASGSGGIDPLSVPIPPANTTASNVTVTPVTPGSPAATTPTSTPTPASSGTALSGAALSGDTYVSVGAFRNIENAQRQAAAFRNEGFSSTVAQQGNFYYAVVGPYGSRVDAERVVSQVRTSGRDAGIFSGSAVAAPTTSPVAPLASSSSGSVTPTNSSAASTQPAPSPTAGTRYLQVGAYGSAQSAAPQRQHLQGLGYSVFERSESGLVKLVIGPFNDGDINGIRSTLSAQGIDSFPVR